MSSSIHLRGALIRRVLAAVVLAAAAAAIVAPPAGAVPIRAPRFSPPRIEVQPPVGVETEALQRALEGAQPTLRERLERSASEITAVVGRQEMLKECLWSAAQDATQEFVEATAAGVPQDYDDLQFAAAQGCLTSVFPEVVQARIDQVAASLAGQADAVAADAVQLAAPPSGGEPSPTGGSSDESGTDSGDGSGSTLALIVVVVVAIGGGLFFFGRRAS